MGPGILTNLMSFEGLIVTSGCGHSHGWKFPYQHGHQKKNVTHQIHGFNHLIKRHSQISNKKWKVRYGINKEKPPHWRIQGILLFWNTFSFVPDNHLILQCKLIRVSLRWHLVESAGNLDTGHARVCPVSQPAHIKGCKPFFYQKPNPRT